MATIDISMIVKAVNDASSNLRQVREDVAGIGTTADRVSNQLRAIQVVMAGIVVNKAAQLSETFLKSAVAIDNARNRMAVALGTFREADAVIESINKNFEGTTADTTALTEAMIKLSQAGLDPVKARQVVESIGRLSLLSNDSKTAINNMTEALVKMLGRGTTDMRAFLSGFQQVPNAIGLIANAAGKSWKEDFEAAIRNGAYTVDQILSFLAKSTSSNFDGIIRSQRNSISGAFTLLTNALDDSLRSLQDTRIGTAVIDRIKAVRQAIDDFVSSLKNLDPSTVDRFFGAIDNAAKTAVNLATGLAPLAQLLGLVTEGILKMLAAVPPEALALGLFAYLFVGKTGAVAVTSVATLASTLLGRIGVSSQQMIDKVNQYLPFGIIGLLIYGPLGAAVGVAAAALLDGLITKVGDLAVKWEGTGSKANAAWAAARASGQTFFDMVGTQFTSMDQKSKNAISAVATAMAGVNKGQDVFELIKDHATAAGLSVSQTAALIAHAKAESDLGQNLVGDKGHSFGLFQFNDKGELPGLIQFADKAGKDWLDFGTQIDYVIQRAQNATGKFGDMWKAAASPEQASVAFNEFERFKGYQDPLNAQVQQRIALSQQYARALLEQSAAALKASTAPSSGKISADEAEKLTNASNTLDARTQSIAAQFAKIGASLRGDVTSEKIADLDRSTGEWKKTLQETLATVDKLLSQNENKPGAEDQVAKLRQDHTVLTQLLKDETAQYELQKANTLTLGQLLTQRLTLEQQMLQLRAQQAEIALKTEFNNDPLANLVKGTSAGQIMNQVLQQQVQLQQQIVGYEQIINQEQQKRLTASDQQKVIIDQTIAKYQSLTAATQTALANLSAEGVATNQLWQSIGNTIENGVVNGISGLITHTMTLQQVGVQVFNALTQAAVKYLFQLMIIKSFGDSGLFSGIGGFLKGGGLLGGLFAANGAIVPTGVRMFADGGIIAGPTLFGMAGEKGTEAIMPLERVGGKLGVRTTGSGGDVHLHLSAIDTQSGVQFLAKHSEDIQSLLVLKAKLNRGMKRAQL